MQGSAFVAAGDPLLARTDDLEFARTFIEAAGDDEALADTARSTLTFVDTHADALRRTCTAGHLTGSALVVDATAERTLVLFHTKLRRWLQPGGHADGDANLAAVALREAEEETGIIGLRVLPRPVDIDVHRVNPAHETPAPPLRRAVPRAGARGSAQRPATTSRWSCAGSTEYDLGELGADRGLQRLARTGFAAGAIAGAGSPGDPTGGHGRSGPGRPPRRCSTVGPGPGSGAMAIWSDVREHAGDGYAELQAFVGLAAEWQVNASLRPVIEDAIRQACAELPAGRCSTVAGRRALSPGRRSGRSSACCSSPRSPPAPRRCGRRPSRSRGTGRPGRRAGRRGRPRRSPR